jgi:catechol 2,3-dioxygenase-like lactoylglutathione lyase family enzyme
MPATRLYHVGLRVMDLERAVRFYVDVFGGRQLTNAYELQGQRADTIYGHEGSRLHVSHVGFAEGAVELLCWVEPKDVPDTRRASGAGPFPHFGVTVDDIHAAHAAVEPAGGRLLTDVLWSVRPDSGRSLFFCEDPDGNVVEAVTSGLEDSLRLIHEAQPDTNPS